LAEAQLGRQSALAFDPPALAPADALRFIGDHPEAKRAAALAQIGRLSDVEQELRLLHGRIAPSEDRLFLDFADALAAPSAQLRAAEFGGPGEGWGYCPTMSFAPEDGFRLDRAALFAVTRQESRYSPVAVSASNARGLMQLLPSTAMDVDPSRPFRAHPELLDDPGVNMRLGQTYLLRLLTNAAPDGDLAKLFAAYNGGPGWLTRWLAANPDAARDPLMLIESLPRAESRDYAERVLANMGLCRKRFGQESAEFDELASGKAARYVRLDK
jgi:soluble lytic murein transglycosylase-like protein